MESKTEKAAVQPAAAIMTTPAPKPAPAARRLHPAAIRLVAVAVLLAGWLGYLAFLVVKMPESRPGEPLILSRPQLLVSEVDVIARVDSAEPLTSVTIEEVLFPKENSPLQVGQEIRVTNLPKCKRLPLSGEKPADVPLDWNGPGSYLLPLQHIDGHDYKVTPTPASPGYPPSRDAVGPPRIYPATAAAKAEYRAIKP
jgi:hypothetical protein